MRDTVTLLPIGQYKVHAETADGKFVNESDGAKSHNPDDLPARAFALANQMVRAGQTGWVRVDDEAGNTVFSFAVVVGGCPGEYVQARDLATLAVPPKKMEEFTDDIRNDQDRNDRGWSLKSLAVELLKRGEYLTARSHSNNHDKAVKVSEKKYVQARKLAGYTYPAGHRGGR